MSITVCELHNIQSLNQLFDELTRQLKLPAHFGRNLDALYDVLSQDVPGPVEIIWRETELSRQQLGADVYATLLEILTTVATERGDMTLDIHH